ncbi:MAG: SEC-C domain-containing protein [Thiovulaceae bacterium]|nr:SEC-C domain-containing protein [Sulfurimonadaceae bacterium]
MMCPCGSNKRYHLCCEPLHAGLHKAQDPEQLMRSRYSAFVMGEAEYLLKTSMNRHHAPDELEQLKAQMGLVEWLKLEVVNGYADIVEFKAYFRDKSGLSLLHEKSKFIFEDGAWLYEEGTLFNTKIERNAACPCGSGKKYKKCCG